MASRPDRAATPRPPLTRERVLVAATDLADRVGIAGLTMRRLGAELGVEAMTLYHHVGHKEALVGAIADRVVTGFLAPPEDGPAWQDDVRDAMRSAHAALEAHPWACPYLQGSGPLLPARIGWMESLLRRLRSAGFSAWLTHHAYHVLDSHLIGSTLWAAGYATSQVPLADQVQAFRASLDPAAFPALLEHIDQHLGPPAGDDRPTFDVGLDLILDGLARLLSDDAASSLQRTSASLPQTG